MRDFYPEIAPYISYHLRVDAQHELYVEEAGNPKGQPVVFLHGGPGAGITPSARRFFDPERYRVILFDQRGAGHSVPHASLSDNTTWHLVADIETLRAHLGIDRWIVFGGSWGSTLALAYAQKHPQSVVSLVLRGIFLGRQEEVSWLNEMGAGASWIFPERWARYRDYIPEQERGNLVEAYWRRLDSPDAQVRLQAALAWGDWEGGIMTLLHEPYGAGLFETHNMAIGIARAEAHYFRNQFFLEPGQLLRDIDRIRHIPAVIVHGRYDVVCPAKSAYELACAWPEATLNIVQGGHTANDPEIRSALIEAMDRQPMEFIHSTLP
ncbi:prolyl aminopeptidase [Pseudomonas gingeri]|uniref:prolyl aminopeptidase n=1 Tax=Pseudomonas gingeri TaxID=117681 RepID=UPI00159FA367|nr:prolyl aminopeptidase [Pseudomonas gingeri]NWD04159.1 prolyl aminopeptidase [Pseudomonas gingeri]NWE34209.1 prolyl aminopeptidase [Pseudomonas gingeri]NWE56539.1 prolyl aminopeptidase [Pseudomonas gingeri]NWF05755.1 prolyl aminopeptidase [Pseudomonas gingeri]